MTTRSAVDHDKEPSPVPHTMKEGVRADVFRHLAGIAVVPTVAALAARGIPQSLCDGSKPRVIDASTLATHVNEGYLQVAMRLLVGAGWVQFERTPANAVSYRATSVGCIAFRIATPLFEELASFLQRAIFIDNLLFERSSEGARSLLGQLVRRSYERWNIDRDIDDPVLAKQIASYLTGTLIGPVMVALARRGIFDRLRDGPLHIDDLGGNDSNLRCAVNLLVAQGWLTASETEIALTTEGSYAAQIAPAYGVTVSYLPTFTQLPNLIFGNAELPRVDDDGNEVLVDRAMNVWGSGGAHATYFKRIDEIIIEVFNRPLDDQPRGICDMGCGDGTLLRHLFTIVRDRTLRGQHLETHPLAIVGADFNKVARRVTRRTLNAANIPNALVIQGDVNRPAQLAAELENHRLDSHDLLHVRSFLDHNRPYTRLRGYRAQSRDGSSSGAFAYRGRIVPVDELEENLVRHLRRWAPYVAKFGLLVLELHTLPPQLSAAHGDRTPALAYDATHGYSDQYLVEVPVFMRCAQEAGLTPDPRFSCRFPDSELATVTINYFSALPTTGGAAA